MDGVVDGPVEVGVVLEAELPRGLGVRAQLPHGQVDSPQVRAHLHVGALDVQPAGGLYGRRRLTGLPGQPAPDEEGLPGPGAAVGEVVEPGLRDGVLGRGPGLVGPQQEVEPDDVAAGIEDGAVPVRADPPPVAEQIHRLGALVAAGDRQHVVPVLLAGGLDGQVLGAAGEEGLPARGVLDQVQHVGRVAPQLRAARAADLRAQPLPGGAAVPAVPLRVVGTGRGGDRLPDGVVDHQPVGAAVDEGERRQAAVERPGVPVREDRRQQGHGRPPHRRRGHERLPRGGVVHALQEVPAQLPDHARDPGVPLSRASGPEGGGGRELQGEGMAPGEGLDPVASVLVDAHPLQQLAGRVVGEGAQPDGTDQLPPAGPGEPRARGRVAARHDQPCVAGEGRDEGAPEPAVQEAQPLVRVHEEDGRRVQAIQAADDPLERGVRDVEPTAQVVEEAALARLDVPAVHRDDDGAGVPEPGGQGVEERRLPDARDAVDEADHRAVGVEAGREGVQRPLASDDGPGHLAVEKIPDLLHGGSGLEEPGADSSREAPGAPDATGSPPVEPRRISVHLSPREFLSRSPPVQERRPSPPRFRGPGVAGPPDPLCRSGPPAGRQYPTT